MHLALFAVAVAIVLASVYFAYKHRKSVKADVSKVEADVQSDVTKAEGVAKADVVAIDDKLKAKL